MVEREALTPRRRRNTHTHTHTNRLHQTYIYCPHIVSRFTEPSFATNTIKSVIQKTFRATERAADLPAHVATHLPTPTPESGILGRRRNLPLVVTLARGINRVDEVPLRILGMVRLREFRWGVEEQERERKNPK